jgi:hypothetical protein
MTKPELLKILNLPDAFAGWQGTYRTVQGWNGGQEILPRLIAERRPKFIIEVGAWLGLSTLIMGTTAKNLGLRDTCILTVDTWLGSLEHWRDDKGLLKLQQGFPALYPQFLDNVVSRQCADVIVPLPMPSTIAARYLAHFNLKADLIFFDGSHDQKDVYDDLCGYFPLLASGGVMCGDDFQWPGVAASVKQFCEEQGRTYTLTPGEETIYWQVV